jgi:hypothetical protein
VSHANQFSVQLRIVATDAAGNRQTRTVTIAIV